MTLTAKQRSWGLTALVAVGVYLFWWLCYPALLNYHEHQQMFLLTWDYAWNVVKYPGGVAHFVSEFLTQFFLFAWAAALVMALLFALTQRLTWHLMKGATEATYGLSFVPAALMMIAMGDDNTMLCSSVALALALVAALGIPRSDRGILIYTVVATPILYWLIGPAAMISAALAAARHYEIGGRNKGLGTLGIGLVMTTAMIYIAARTMPFMVGVVVRGVYYYRYALSMNALIPIAMASAALIPACRTYLGRIETTRAGRWSVGSIAVMALTFKLLLPVAYKPFVHDTLEYVYLEREGRWNEIIAKAEKQSPEGGIGLTAVNLALAKTNQLGNRLFDFDQHGMDGLLPPYKISSPVTLAASEVCYNIGLVNEAQRFAFDSMESMVNGKKSARIIKRLAETNLVNGDYDVAMKYLLLLRKTLFYSKWATRTLQLLSYEEAIDMHPVYGRLRRVKLNNDFLFSEKEIDKMVGQVYLRDTQNTIAMQYLLAIPLIRQDLDTFMNYYEIVKEDNNYRPRSVTEAMAYAYAQRGQRPPQGLISDFEVKRLKEFVGIINQENDPNSPRISKFKKTAWYYLSKHETDKGQE